MKPRLCIGELWLKKTSSIAVSDRPDGRRVNGHVPAATVRGTEAARRTFQAPAGSARRLAVNISGARKSASSAPKRSTTINYKDLPAAWAVRGGERKNRAPPADGRMFAASAPAGGGDQAGAQHRIAAVRGKSAVTPTVIIPSAARNFVLAGARKNQDPCFAGDDKIEMGQQIRNGRNNRTLEPSWKSFSKKI